jgi:hypothetical protein
MADHDIHRHTVHVNGVTVPLWTFGPLAQRQMDKWKQQADCAHEWRWQEEVDVDSRSITWWEQCVLCDAVR